MTRHESPPNPIGVAAWVGGTIAALAVILLYREPALFVWLVVVALVVWAMAATAAAFHLGSRLVDSDAERLSDADRITALEDVIASLDQENARLHGMQTERDLLAGEAVHVPLLRGWCRRSGRASTTGCLSLTWRSPYTPTLTTTN